LRLYNRIRKVEPLDQAFKDLGVSCWASGVRGGQTEHRQQMRPLENVRGLWSLRPLLSWSRKDVFYYMERHGLPQHPLFEQGYSTVGDWHSSGPDSGDVSGRATRFGGLSQECGIHLPGCDGRGHLRWPSGSPPRWLLIGNSRWHWAEQGDQGLRFWDEPPWCDTPGAILRLKVGDSRRSAGWFRRRSPGRPWGRCLLRQV
jgi:hypothetical protein